MRRFLHDNSLTLAFGLAFLVVLACQAVAGHAEFNQQLAVDGLAQIGLGEYVMSSDFAVDVTENWQSELLAVASMAVLSVYLRQRGSPESKPVGAAHTSTGVEG
ncbi:DUF6766 family protein [Streptomyces formicae]|uniref:Integral membrane protein n=1 Tax=Streptomyces formicae TaxID=1616117 RepID=A0ABY3WLK2_9ACTN|nr:DUF6766 family protein [Streptomyces formicae]UNM13499.1 hypothetical protein J4032_20260 [Streptomyces formicae]